MKKMNNIRILWLAVATMVLAACQKEAPLPAENSPTKGLRVEVEGFNGQGTKMMVEHTSVEWTDGDSIWIEDSKYPLLLENGVATVEYAGQGTDIEGVHRLNACFPASIAAGIAGSYNDIDVDLRVPASYKSSHTPEGQQLIQLPMVGGFPSKDGGASQRMDCLEFKHLTAALLVKVRNDSRHPMLVDRVVVSSESQQLSGRATVVNHIGDAEGGITVTPSGNGETASDKQVEVLFADPQTVPVYNAGTDDGIIAIQVPILPVGDEDNALTVRVECRSIIVGIVGKRDMVFQYTVQAGTLARKEMKTMQISLNPSNSDRVSIASSVGTFSVNADGKQVLFSSGNLQVYTPGNSWGGSLNWRFLEHQYSIGDETGRSVSDHYQDENSVSLFGWGANGNQTSPLNTDELPEVYTWPPAPDGDWGVHRIINGGNRPYYGWRTMTADEWKYLLSLDEHDNDIRRGKWATVTVGEKGGLLLLPDLWTGDAIAQNCTLTLDRWEGLETLGAVFLPMAGIRTGTAITPLGGHYWTCSPYSDSYAMALLIAPGTVLVRDMERSRGMSVRLVIDAN